MTDVIVSNPPEKPATPPAETPPPAAAKAPDPMAPKFAALAKKDRAARAALDAAKAKEAEIAKREAAIAERERIWEEEWKKSPLEALKKRNVSYQDITNAALSDGKFEPTVEIKRVQDEIQNLRKENEEKERRQQESQKEAQAAAEAQAVEQYKGNIGKHIAANAEKYELTKLYDASELVFQTVESHFERTQKVLSLDEACQLVEDYLESELERTSKESKKFQAKFLAQKAAEKDEKGAGKTSTTISNHMQTSSAPSMLPAKTENDRIQRALAALS